jgi:apolipoprotein D and lipocalin family protein
MKLLWLFIIIPAYMLMTGCRSTSKLEVVSNFEIERYLGVWYEAARLPHGFEKNLSSVSATYSFNEDATIKVLNRGFNDKKLEWEEIEGVAKFKSADDQGWLKVSFFKPFYASYKVIYLNEDYTQAIITGPSYGYLWILVREPALPKTEVERLITKAAAFGFETEKLILVDQTRNLP